TAVSRLVEPFSSSLVIARALLASAPVEAEDAGAQQLVCLPHLRTVRARDSGFDGCDVVRLRDAAPSSDARPDDPVRVRRLDRPAAPEPLHDQLLPDGDALHRLRHRDRLPLSAGRDPPQPRVVRLRRVPLLPRDPRGRVHLHLAKGGARMALRDYGLKSERVLWTGKGPGVFET